MDKAVLQSMRLLSGADIMIKDGHVEHTDFDTRTPTVHNLSALAQQRSQLLTGISVTAAGEVLAAQPVISRT